MAADYVVIAVTLILSTCCWWAIRRSNERALVKIVLTLVAAVPFIGPFVYLFASGPRRAAPAPIHEKQSAFMRRWNEREHIYLGCAALVFWSLAVLAYWMNDWSPGAIRKAPFNLGFYTDVDRIFFALLIGTILAFGAAVRAKAALMDRLKHASALLAPQR